VAAEIIIAGIHATLTALDIWHRERDRAKAHRVFEQASQTITPERQAEARQLGITQFEMSPGLHDSPKFIRALGQIVMDAVGTTVQSYAAIGGAGSLASPVLVAAD